jgi:hypothetical protein
MGSRRLNLRQFFTVTGVLLIVFAAGKPVEGVVDLEGVEELRVVTKPAPGG